MKTTSRSPVSALWMMPILLLMVACSDDDDAEPDLCAPSTLSVSAETFQLNAYAQPSGGVLPYSLEWSNGATADSLFNIFPGNYSLTVTDAEGCTASTGFELINFCSGSNLTVNLIASLLSVCP